MNNNNSVCKQIKLAVLGAAGVGKSAMIVRFITGRFLHHYDPTLEDEYSIETVIEGQRCSVSIMDTAGENSGNSNHYLQIVDAVLIVFSLDDHSSLEVAKQLLQTVRSHNLKHPPVVLVGTKCDLRSHQRVLSYDDALIIANDFNCTYVETSSAVNINVLEAFQTALKKVIMLKTEKTSKCVCTEKKNQRSTNVRVKGILSRLNPFRKEKKLLDSLAVSSDVDCGRFCDTYIKSIAR